MGVNKVVYNTADGEQVLMDLTGDSVTPETMLAGTTAHDASGEPIEGAVMTLNGTTEQIPNSLAILVPYSDFGDAQPSDVKSGKIFTSSAGLKVVGTGSGGSSESLLYGTYMLREFLALPALDDVVFFDFSIVDAFTYFYNGEDYEYRYIDNISLSDDGYVFITSDGGDYCTVFDTTHWYADGIGEFPDSRYKIIDIKTPLSVTQDSYDLFMGIVDCNTEETPYEVGYDVGLGSGDGAPVLYGTYMLKAVPNYTSPYIENLSIDLSQHNVYGYRLNPISFSYNSISKMEAKSRFEIHFSEGSVIYGETDKWASSIWAGHENLAFHDDRYRVIDFKEPVVVDKEMYDIFMSLVDNTDDTPYAVGESIGESAGMGAGIEIGRQQQYDEFWDAFQNNGDRTSYTYAFYQWGDDAFYPKYDMTPVNASAMFNQLKAKNFKQRLIDCGVTLDLSQATTITDIFGISTVTHVPVINTTSAKNLNSIFYNCRIVDIEKLILKSDGSQTLSDSFKWCESLQNIVIEGTIGQNGLNLQWSTKLSKDSITSVMNALSDNTSGLSVTLSLTAINNAYNQGVNSAQWQEWLHSKSNWTINLW